MKNGYGPTILLDADYCALCGRRDRPLQRHEVFHGPYRAKSKALGLWVAICDLCHHEVHNGDGRLDRNLKCWGQKAAMDEFGWSEDDFRKHFGKSYVR